jgi:hypothetical protein
MNRLAVEVAHFLQLVHKGHVHWQRIALFAPTTAPKFHRSETFG